MGNISRISRIYSGDATPCRMIGVALHSHVRYVGDISGDKNPCRMNGVTLHRVVSPDLFNLGTPRQIVLPITRIQGYLTCKKPRPPRTLP